MAGNDLTIICSDSAPDCRASSTLPFLQEDNLYPGFVKNPPQKLTIINRRRDDCRLSLGLSSIVGSKELSENIQISINHSSRMIFRQNLSQLKKTLHSIDTIASKSTRDYQVYVSLPASLGNQFQNLSTSFNADFHFTCQLPDSSSGQIKGVSTTSRHLSFSIILPIFTFLILFILFRFR